MLPVLLSDKFDTHHLPVLLLPLLLFLSLLYWMPHFGLFLLLPFWPVLLPPGLGILFYSIFGFFFCRCFFSSILGSLICCFRLFFCGIGSLFTVFCSVLCSIFRSILICGWCLGLVRSCRCLLSLAGAAGVSVGSSAGVLAVGSLLSRFLPVLFPVLPSLAVSSLCGASSAAALLSSAIRN